MRIGNAPSLVIELRARFSAFQPAILFQRLGAEIVRKRLAQGDADRTEALRRRRARRVALLLMACSSIISMVILIWLFTLIARLF